MWHEQLENEIRLTMKKIEGALVGLAQILDH